MSRLIRISEARSKLPELARYLVQHPDQVVWVEHRDLGERLALTTEGHLRYLQTVVRELRKRVSRPFTLAGSIATDLGDQELEIALREMTAEQAELREEKLRRLAS